MFRQWLHKTLSEIYPDVRFDVLVPPDAKMGDYSTNIAMVAKKNAQEVCDALVAKGGDMIEKCQVAGPGFVNIFLKDEYLRIQLAADYRNIQQTGNGQKVIVEYSSPNIAKPMHVGHLRSTIIGDALSRVYQELDYDVVRWNYLGDWGTQFGKMIAGHKKWPDMPVVTVEDMAALYVRANAELEEDAGRTEFKKLEDGDSENRQIWMQFRTTSLAEFQRTYALLNISFDQEKGESAYESELPAIIRMLEEKGLAKESEGALIVDLGDLPPGMIRKSDGATTYLARDIASLEDRITIHHPAKILYVIANQQALHMQQLFAIKEKLSLGQTELVHVKYGLVLGEDGKKFSTRQGNTVPLQEVIDEIVRRAAEKNPDTAQAIGMAALKYNDLKQHPYSDIIFNWDAMLDLGGNSGPYLQYTYARLTSIIAKGFSFWLSVFYGQKLDRLIHPLERALLRHMLDFGYVVEQAAKDYALNGLALHLYELANLANRYYEQVRINDDKDRSRKLARLQLIGCVAVQIEKGLSLLGIETLERI